MGLTRIGERDAGKRFSLRLELEFADNAKLGLKRTV